MKKIMFNDKYGLTKAVLEGRKTMTRRIITDEMAIQSLNEQEFMQQLCLDERFVKKYSRYQIGEVVAVAQSYKDVGFSPNDIIGHIDNGGNMYGFILAGDVPGWSNKMFVKAEFMQNFIRITDIRVERLQDISEEDCLLEGVKQWTDFTYCVDGIDDEFIEAREAFAALIDKVSGRGTWDKNPWVFVYTYELVK